jgi:hypothetical protein
MLFRKTPPPTVKSFSRVFPSRWILEYYGTLPHCQKQGVAIVHTLQCRRITPSLLSLEAGLSNSLSNAATHELWCVCRIPKDRGGQRLLFRQHLDLATVLGADRRDWIAYKVTQHLCEKLRSSTDLYYLIRCNYKREYPWCAESDDLDDYWSADMTAKAKGLIRLMER